MQSAFLGSKKDYYVYDLSKWLVSIASLLVLTPLVVYNFEKWRTTNSQISGKMLVFKGKLWHAYGIFLVWFCLFGAFLAISNYVLYVLDLLLPHNLSFWVVNGIVILFNAYLLRTFYRMWVKRCLAFEGSVVPTIVKTRLWATIRFAVLAWFISVFSLNLAAPSAHQLKMVDFAQGLQISGQNLQFLESEKTIYMFWWKDVLLCLATLGFYIPILHYKIFCWRVRGLALAA